MSIFRKKFMILYTSVNSVLKADEIGIEIVFCFSSELEQPGEKLCQLEMEVFKSNLR